MGDPLRGKPVKAFELLIGALVLAVLICMIVIISKVDVNWGDAFKGFLPSKHIFAPGGVYTSVGILGATVMPHSLFIGSALATQDRISIRSIETLHSKGSEDSLTVAPVERMTIWRRFYELCKSSVLNAFRKPPASAFVTHPTMLGNRQNNSYAFVNAHILHGAIDVVGSLLGFAVMINSLILMLAAAVFYYGQGQSNADSAASLFDAYDLIRDLVGQTAATLFAIALLCAGQSSSIIATVAGQAVCEGFLHWRVSAIVRRLLTRLLAIIPAMAVAIAIGRSGIDTLLVASQVVLSIVLPFIIVPLLYCTSSKTIMSVRKIAVDTTGFASVAAPGRPRSSTLTIAESPAIMRYRNPGAAEGADTEGEMVDYSNNKLSVAIGGVIWLIIVAANMYVIVDLGLGVGV